MPHKTPGEEYEGDVAFDVPERRRRRGLFGRLFRRRKRDESVENLVVTMAEASLNETLLVPPVEESPLPPVREEALGGRASLSEVWDSLPFVTGVSFGIPLQANGRPTMMASSIPLGLVLGALLLRSMWYFLEHRRRVTASVEDVSISSAHSGNGVANGNGGHASNIPSASQEVAEELQRTLEREANEKRRLAQENQTLQHALGKHKAAVDKFSSELQARNERLSGFEREQELVRQQLGSQIDTLKKELQERQRLEQGNLKSKESLCNDLITKIKILNKDLENHEKVWQSVAKKAEQKEAESTAKVGTLQKTLQEEERQRAAALKAKEDACADLAAKLQALQAQHSHFANKNATLERVMGPGVFPAVEERLQSRLQEEQDHATKLTTKLQLFSAEMLSREERVSTLDAKMKEVERLSASELKELQRELQDQIAQREKLQQAAAEMTRLLQEKQTQCVSLQSQWESSKAEAHALDEKVQKLAGEVKKREMTATERIETLQAQLEAERKHVEACRAKSESTNEELMKKQAEFVQLTTRMDLFLKELKFRDEQVVGLESKLTTKEDLATSELKALRSQLAEAAEHRDTWNKSTDDLIQLLKDKKAQVLGLTTRADLFELELKKRQEAVDCLEAKIKERREAEAVKLEPYRKELLRLEGERDSWREKTDEIGCLFEQKKAQSEGLMTRLKLFQAELAKRDERVSILESAYKDKTQSANMNVAPVRKKLEQQRLQRDAWATKTKDIECTLTEKRAQCVGLTTRVQLFRREVETKERMVADLEVIVADKGEAGNSAIAHLKQKLDVHVKARDEWKASTEEVVQLLDQRKNEASGLTGELKLLVGDLQNYQQRRAKLETQIVQHRALHDGRQEALEAKLMEVQGNCDSWAHKTKDLTAALRATEQSIVGLETRSMLFEKELAQRDEVVSKLQKELWPMERKSALKLEQLRGAIAAEKKLHEHGVETTLKVNKDLKNVKRECVGLTTRYELFSREFQKWGDAVLEQEKKILHAESVASSALELLRSALFEKEKARDEWKEKTEEIGILQAENDKAIIGLGTRLPLFMAQVMKEEENVSRTEMKLTSNPNITKEVDAAKERRDNWTTKAIEIEKELKLRRSQVAGLTTRKMLFRVELHKREEQVSALKLKISQKVMLTSESIAPFTKALNELKQKQADWAANLRGINKMLNEKQHQCLPLSKRLEEAIDQVMQCQQRIDILQEQLRDEESFNESKVKGLKARLEQQIKERAAWKKSTQDVQARLQEKRDGVEGLKTRLHVFGGELRKRQEAANLIISKIGEDKKSLTDELHLIDAQIEAEYLERDSIIASTLAKNRELKAMENTCAALTVRCRLFEEELRTREERVILFEAKLKEKEFEHFAAMKRLGTELSARRTDRDKWRDSTQKMASLLEETENECVGLSTRAKLFKLETEKFDKQVADLERNVTWQETDSAGKIAPIQDQLQHEQKERDTWDKKTVELDGMVQDNRREVVGLKTRSKLFLQELKKKDQGVAALCGKIKDEEEEFAKRIEPLLQECNTLKADRDTWVTSTENIKKQLEKTKAECASIPTRLDLFRREQQTRADAVADLEASISNKDDEAAIQLGFLLNELQLQQKQRTKWKKVALEMHRLLKETKDKVGTLTSDLESCNNALKQHQQRVMSLETTLRDARDMTEQQLSTLKNELDRLSQRRDKLRESAVELNRLLGEAKGQCKDLSEKLLASETQMKGCTLAISNLEVRVTEKKALDASQVESIKAQLKIHLGQRAEWQENTNQMKERLKEKQLLCSSLKTKLALLKNMQIGEVRSSLSTDPASSEGNSITSHLEKINQLTSRIGKKSDAEENLTTRMEILEKELRQAEEEKKNLNESTKQLEQGLREKDSQCTDIAGKLTLMQQQFGAGAPFLDVDRMLAETDKKQSKLNSKLESLAGALSSL